MTLATQVVGARFQKAGRMYFFDPAGVTDLSINEWIIVKTDLQSPRLATLDAKASTMIDGFILVDRVGSYSVYRRP